MQKKKTISSNMCPEAQEFLDNLTVLLKSQDILTSLDEATLDLIGQTYHNYILATQEISRFGMFIDSPRGERKAHPAVKVQLDAQIQLNKMMDSFGLSPKSRREISKPKEKAKDKTPIHKYLEQSKRNGEIRNTVKN